MFQPVVARDNGLCARPLEDSRRHVVGGEELAEVVESFDARVRTIGRSVQGVVPLDVEIESLDHLAVRKVEHVLENIQTQHDGDGFIGRAVARMVESGELGLDIDENRQDLLAKRAGPGGFQAFSFRVGQQEFGVEQSFLRGFSREHDMTTVGLVNAYN